MLSLLLSANLMLIFVLLQLLCVQRLRAKEICCETTGCFNDMKPYDKFPLPECTDNGNDDPVFQLYTRENWYTPHVITPTNIPQAYSADKPTRIIAHGWIAKGETGWVLKMKDELMKRLDVNVIVISWDKMANNVWYPQSASNVRTVGAHTALIVNALKAHSSKRTHIWCIGHSLGAHACAQAGINSKLDRITGLDPAGPAFDNKDIETGLYPGSAAFVDIIHTDGIYGTRRILGHLDIFVKKGITQPGCATNICSHNIVTKYFIESIISDCFISNQKCQDPKKIPKSCETCNGCAMMGYAADNSKITSGIFHLETKKIVPYCLGPSSVNLSRLFQN